MSDLDFTDTDQVDSSLGALGVDFAVVVAGNYAADNNVVSTAPHNEADLNLEANVKTRQALPKVLTLSTKYYIEYDVNINSFINFQADSTFDFGDSATADDNFGLKEIKVPWSDPSQNNSTAKDTSTYGAFDTSDTNDLANKAGKSNLWRLKGNGSSDRYFIQNVGGLNLNFSVDSTDVDANVIDSSELPILQEQNNNDSSWTDASDSAVPYYLSLQYKVGDDFNNDPNNFGFISLNGIALKDSQPSGSVDSNSINVTVGAVQNVNVRWNKDDIRTQEIVQFTVTNATDSNYMANNNGSNFPANGDNSVDSTDVANYGFVAGASTMPPTVIADSNDVLFKKQNDFPNVLDTSGIQFNVNDMLTGLVNGASMSSFGDTNYAYNNSAILNVSKALQDANGNPVDSNKPYSVIDDFAFKVNAIAASEAADSNSAVFNPIARFARVTRRGDDSNAKDLQEVLIERAEQLKLGNITGATYNNDSSIDTNAAWQYSINQGGIRHFDEGEKLVIASTAEDSSGTSQQVDVTVRPDVADTSTVNLFSQPVFMVLKQVGLDGSNRWEYDTNDNGGKYVASGTSTDYSYDAATTRYTKGTAN